MNQTVVLSDGIHTIGLALKLLQRCVPPLGIVFLLGSRLGRIGTI